MAGGKQVGADLFAHSVRPVALRADRSSGALHGGGGRGHLRRRFVAREMELQLFHDRADHQHPLQRHRETDGRDLRGEPRGRARDGGICGGAQSMVPPHRGPHRPGRRGLCRGFLQPGHHPQRHARTQARPAQRGRSPGPRSLLWPCLAHRSQGREETRRAKPCQSQFG